MDDGIQSREEGHNSNERPSETRTPLSYHRDLYVKFRILGNFFSERKGSQGSF